VIGYACFGPTPMTDGTWDLYWIVTAPEARGRGVAGALLASMEAEIGALGARMVRVETSGQELYQAAQRLYRRRGYPEVARIVDFYKPGDDLITMIKRL
jgi:ribosomal protein S18 acetylase RimI-like enzyme